MAQTQAIQEMLNSEVSVGALSYFTWGQIVLIVGIFGGLLALFMLRISKQEDKDGIRNNSNTWSRTERIFEVN